MNTEITKSPLTDLESKNLDSLESTIEKSLVVFYEVGAALKNIRDGKLYREVFGTFNDYCRDRGGDESHSRSPSNRNLRGEREFVTHG